MMQAYIEGKREASTIGSLVTLLAFCFGILGVLIAYGTAFGWIPLSDRDQILRSDINTIETIVSIVSLLYAACCLRTGYGLYIREQASLRWSQWMMFTSVMIGGAILLSVAIPVGLKFSLLLGQVPRPENADQSRRGRLGCAVAFGRRGADQHLPLHNRAPGFAGAAGILDPAAGATAGPARHTLDRRAAA